jgi:hypothetical protein
MSQIARLLRLMSTLACVAIVASFALWAADEGRTSSERQIAKLDPTTNVPITTATPAAPPPAETKHGGVRGAIDDAGAALVRPFEGLVTSDDQWVRHGVPALLALLAYGLLARLLINLMYTRR